MQEEVSNLRLLTLCRQFLDTAKTKADIEAIIPVLLDWLKVRGLKLSWEKTQIVSVQQGCHFLGFTIRHLQHK